MKKTICLIIGIFCWFGLSADNLKQMQDSALNYYLKSDFTNALRIYENIYSQNYSSADLFYNLGNCYYNTGDIANAVLYYEKALILNPADKDIINNLSIVNSAVQSKTEALPEVFYKRWYKSLISTFSTDQWAIFAIISFILCLAAIGLYLFSKITSVRKTGFISGLILLCTSFLFTIFASNQANNISSGKYAVIFETSLIKSSPSEESNNLFEVSAGLKVEIKDTLNNWTNIRLSDGKEGWVESGNIKKI